jgi:hypothetical protein
MSDDLTAEKVTAELVAWMITPETQDEYMLDTAPGAQHLPDWVEGRITTTRQGSDLILNVEVSDPRWIQSPVRKTFKVTVEDLGSV